MSVFSPKPDSQMSFTRHISDRQPITVRVKPHWSTCINPSDMNWTTGKCFFDRHRQMLQGSPSPSTGHADWRSQHIQQASRPLISATIPPLSGPPSSCPRSSAPTSSPPSDSPHPLYSGSSLLNCNHSRSSMPSWRRWRRTRVA